MDGNREIHRIRTAYPPEGGYYWECECGIGGSGPNEASADLHSDRHIPEGARRVDVHGGEW